MKNEPILVLCDSGIEGFFDKCYECAVVLFVSNSTIRECENAGHDKSLLQYHCLECLERKLPHNIAKLNPMELSDEQKQKLASYLQRK